MTAATAQMGRLASLVRQGRTPPPCTTAATAIPYDPDRFAVDPRPDLEGDAAWWDRLLWTAYHRDGGEVAGLFQALHGLRACGARLRPDRERLRIDGSHIPDYDELREAYLVPHTWALRTLLAEVQPWA